MLILRLLKSVPCERPFYGGSGHLGRVLNCDVRYLSKDLEAKDARAFKPLKEWIAASSGSSWMFGFREISKARERLCM
jgi:hypothetical protein